MSIEAKQVYEWVKTGHWSKRQFMEWVASTEESSATQEPVGDVILYTGDGMPCAPFKQVKWCDGMMPPEGTKLYTHPQPKAEQEPVAWGVHDQIALSKTLEPHLQPKREWVGLTEEDFVCVNQTCRTPIEGAEYALFLLKEKNT